MENSKGLKLVVAILALLTILNTYRIETVDEGGILDFQSDSLEVAEEDVYARIAILEKTVAELQSTVMSQQSKIARLTTSKPARRAEPKPKVEVKVRVENRYVEYKPTLPEAKAGCTGVVVIEVKMNSLGRVGSAAVASGTTITDEDVLYSCKEAALKTGFAYNPEAPRTSIGTITYTFN